MIPTDVLIGLKRSDIEQLQKKHGLNSFNQTVRGGFLHFVWDIIKDPMFIMLMAACAIYFLLGELREGVLMLAAMIFVGAISIYQETRSSRALDALKRITDPKIRVIREGFEESIPVLELVPGDLMMLEEGNTIPADAIVVRANDLTVNESILTGESFPVEKKSNEPANTIFQGTLIQSGKCYSRVTATGNHTRLSKIGKTMSSIISANTPLQIQIGKFVRVMAIFGASAFGLIWLVNYVNNGSITQSLLLGLTLAMSAVPEEIPVAFSSFMALGALQMSKLGIIARQPQTVENLGAVTVICLDKTGTITENRMEVKKILDYGTNSIIDFDSKTDKGELPVLAYARLASEEEPFDPMEKAIVSCYKDMYTGKILFWNMIHEYPLGGKPPMMTHVHRREETIIAAGKGAPERIMRICKLDSGEVDKIEKLVHELGSSGYRVLGVCHAEANKENFPVNQDDFNWKFEGLIALHDPPKKDLSAVFQKWYKVGINIKLLTGDYPETAINIARMVGIKKYDQCVLADDIMNLSIEELQKKVREKNVFARLFPEAKLKIIQALIANGEIVAMSGDGVNDGPALRLAHIGIAMGRQGTDLAKAAADLILTDDNLDKITDAIQQGRKIYNNLKKAIRYIISIHIPIILTASLPLLLGWKIANIFTPIHIIFLELIMGPTCSIFYEREPVEPSIMKKPPRKVNQNMFSLKELWISIIQGMAIACGILVLYYSFMRNGYAADYVRAIVFNTLIISNVFLTLVNRSFTATIDKTIRYENSLAKWVVMISLIFLCSLQFIKPVQSLFSLSTLKTPHYLLCIAISLIVTGSFEVYKMVLKGNQKERILEA
jgi:Ca2+-transporting ATPase